MNEVFIVIKSNSECNTEILGVFSDRLSARSWMMDVYANKVPFRKVGDRAFYWKDVKDGSYLAYLHKKVNDKLEESNE